MGRPKLTEEQMSKKQLQKQKINERYAMKKKMGTILTLTNTPKIEREDIFNIPVPEKVDNRLEVPIRAPQLVMFNSAWGNIEGKMSEPEGILYAVFSVSITSYLVYQSILSMKLLDHDIISAVSSSIVSEMIPIVCSGLMVSTTKRSGKIFLSVIMAMSIIGLSNFFESSISSTSNKGGDVYQSLIMERESIKEEVKSAKELFASLPENHITDRKTASKAISESNAKLSIVNDKIIKTESLPSNKGETFYMIWIRICAILVNCYVIHSLFIYLKK